jgi:DNA-directed RNA polymerase subunit M
MFGVSPKNLREPVACADETISHPPTSSMLTERIETEMKESVPAQKRIEIIENVEINPKIKTRCEKCGNTVAYYWTQQTRGADEPETRFFKCTKCSYTWREYA